MGNAAKKRESRGSELSLSNETDAKEWRTRDQLTLLIENLPIHWMIGDLKGFLDGFGNVFKAEIFEDHEVQSPSTISDCRLVSLTDEGKLFSGDLVSSWI